jgi:hypothetical protein
MTPPNKSLQQTVTYKVLGRGPATAELGRHAE